MSQNNHEVNRTELSIHNFNYEFSGDEKHWKWELAFHPRYTNPWTVKEAVDVKDRILRNQDIIQRIKELSLDVPAMVTYEEFYNIVGDYLK